MPCLIHIGQPVGWCISDSEAGDVIGAFLGAIQGRSPSTSVNAIMTDDGTCLVSSMIILYANYSVTVDNTGWSAAKGVFGDSLKHLLCHWHVDRYCFVHMLSDFYYCTCFI